MDRIEDIWDNANEQISKDKTFTEEFVRQSISETSISITSKLPKIIWIGIVASVFAVMAFVYNIFFYLENTPVLVLIFILIIITIALFVYLLNQLTIVKNVDRKDLDLKSLLLFKINYFNKQFQIVQHCVALSIILVTFTINLTMENSDGVFEFHKILILSVFYILIYIGTVFLYRISYSVYLKQLRNALFNLEENTLKSFDEELKKHKRLRKIIGLIIILLLSIGLIFLLF